MLPLLVNWMLGFEVMRDEVSGHLVDRAYVSLYVLCLSVHSLYNLNMYTRCLLMYDAEFMRRF